MTLFKRPKYDSHFSCVDSALLLNSDLALLRVEGHVRDVVREAAEVLHERRVGGGHVVGVADTLETVYKVTIYKIKSLIK